MMTKIKRAIVFTFFAFLISDICTYILAFIDNHKLRIKDFYFIASVMSNDSKIINLSIVYFIIVSGIYFVFNFFKPNYDTRY